MTHIRCPLCRQDVFRRLRQDPLIEILRCCDCGFIFRVPVRDGYLEKCTGCQNRCSDRVLEEEYLRLRKAIERRRLQRIAILTGIDFCQSRILEIGCGLGFLASFLNEKALEYWGTEPSPLFFKRLGDTRLGIEGRLLQTLLPDKERRKYFDLAVVVDVLQYVCDPLVFIERLKSYVKDTGVFYIEVPDESFPGIRFFIRRRLRLYAGSCVHPGHQSFFTPATLETMLNKAGFRVVKTAHVSLAADSARMRLTVNRQRSSLFDFFCSLLGFLKLDILFKQGNVAVAARRMECQTTPERPKSSTHGKLGNGVSGAMGASSHV